MFVGENKIWVNYSYCKRASHALCIVWPYSAPLAATLFFASLFSSCQTGETAEWTPRTETEEEEVHSRCAHWSLCRTPCWNMYFLKTMWPVESRGKAWEGGTGREKLLYTDHNPLPLCTTQRWGTACPTWCLVWMRCEWEWGGKMFLCLFLFLATQNYFN